MARADVLWAKGQHGAQKFFRSNRVSSGLAKWLKSNPAPASTISEKDQLRADKLRKEIRNLDFDYAIKMGEYLPRRHVEEAQTKAKEGIMAILKKMMTREDYNAAIRQFRSLFSEPPKGTSS